MDYGNTKTQHALVGLGSAAALSAVVVLPCPEFSERDNKMCKNNNNNNNNKTPTMSQNVFVVVGVDTESASGKERGAERTRRSVK